MRSEGRYSVAICKGAALLDDTEKLLEQWSPEEPTSEFAKRVQKEGVLGNATAYRANDIIRRVFIPRFLKPDNRPAKVMKAVLAARMPPSVFRELVLLFAARNDPLIRDYIVSEFWPAVRRGRQKMDVESVLSFFSEAIIDGRIETPWSEKVSKKTARGILGLLRDVGFARDSSRGRKDLVDYRLSDESLLIIAYLLHDEGNTDVSLVGHQDWALFGLDRQSLLARMQLIDEEQGLLLQQAGSVVSINWKLKSLDHFFTALYRQKNEFGMFR
jgi:hypothetical protein